MQSCWQTVGNFIRFCEALINTWGNTFQQLNFIHQTHVTLNQITPDYLIAKILSFTTCTKRNIYCMINASLYFTWTFLELVIKADKIVLQATIHDFFFQISYPPIAHPRKGPNRIQCCHGMDSFKDISQHFTLPKLPAGASFTKMN